jgi:cholesterol transport system auxiliary component
MKHPISAPDRRIFLVAISAFALAGCSGLIGPPDVAQVVYLLRAEPTPLSGSKVGWALAINRPDASDSLDTDRIALMHSNIVADYYAGAVWSDQLPDLVQTALLAGFQSSGRIDAVARNQDALHADYVLDVDIRDFSAHYSSAAPAPSVVVTLVAQIATAHGRGIVSTFTADQIVPATANSVDAVVTASNTAMAAAVRAILDWALALPSPTVSIAG